MDPQLEALVAIVDHGSFDVAARHLHVTPSAVSQRIRALESSAGQVLLVRASPCRPTEAGQTWVRLGRQVRLLHDEARAAPQVDLAVAVNADSLATWFGDVLEEVGGWPEVALRLQVEDQAWSSTLLRSGDCLAAVTSSAEAVQGCSVEPLGVLRYRPAATPALVARWRTGPGGRSVDWARLPVVVFNAKDDLQDEVLRRRGVARPSVVHQVPTSTGFHEAVRHGLGWGMLPDPQLDPDLVDGRLVTLPGGGHVDVPLHWQRWRLDSLLLDRLSDAVRAAARRGLRH